MNAEDFILPVYSTQQCSQQKRRRSRTRSPSPPRDQHDQENSQMEVVNQLWVDKYEPAKEAEVAVSTNRINAIKDVFENSALDYLVEDSPTLKKLVSPYKLLVLTGPTGCGKSTLLKILCRKYRFDVTEWITPYKSWQDRDESPIEEFRRFMQQATYLNTLSSASKQHKGRIILLDDIPDITSESVKLRFKSILQECLDIRKEFLIVMIASDAHTESDDYKSKRNYVQSLVPDESDKRVKIIDFKPVTDTNMKKILTHISIKEHISHKPGYIDDLIEASNGDIRSAINTLQFFSHSYNSSVLPQPSQRKKRKLKKDNVVEFDKHIGRLSLFHAIGKVVYAKRNPDGTYESKPEHIINKIPVDNDTFIDYVHQNCVEFFNSIEDCAAALDGMSDADTLKSTVDWQDRVSSRYRNFIAIHSVMKNRYGVVIGQFKELAGCQFPKLRYELMEKKREEHEKAWMADVESRLGYYKEENPGEYMDLTIEDPIELFSGDEENNKDDDDDMDFDKLFGDGSELASLDF